MWLETGLVLLLSIMFDQAAGQCKDPMLFKLTEIRNQMNHLTHRVENQVCLSYVSITTKKCNVLGIIDRLEKRAMLYYTLTKKS